VIIKVKKVYYENIIMIFIMIIDRVGLRVKLSKLGLFIFVINIY